MPPRAATSSKRCGAAATCCANRTRKKCGYRPDRFSGEPCGGSRLPTEPRREWRGFCFLRPALCQTHIAGAANVELFDHRIGTCKKRRWNLDTQCFGSFEIDVNLVSIWLFDRKVGRLMPSNNLININSTLPCNRKEIRPQADYVDKIIRGHKPADLPEQPDRYEIYINLKTAKTLRI